MIFTKKTVDWIIKKFYPPRCIFCNTVMEDKVKLRVCKKCAAEIKRVPAEHCPICGKVSPLGNSVCWSCSMNKIPYNSHSSVYFYEGNVRKSLIRFKFRNKPQYAETMGMLMAAYAPASSNFDIITYVPMSKHAVKTRGYNQTKLLAESISRILGKPCEESLSKIKETKRQSSLKFKQRQKNVVGAYLGDENLTDKTVLLIDDIFTTGATFKECAKALKKAGVKEINCLSFAMTRGFEK